LPDLQQNITAFWDAVARGYETHPGNVSTLGSPQYEQWVEIIRSALPAPPSDVLDVATGTGFLALLAATLGHRVTGVDLSAEMLAVARRAASEREITVSLGIADAVAPPFVAESFDVITNRHLLWTLRDPQAAMRNWHELLRPGGRLVVVDGFWSADMSAEEPGDDATNVFGQHYTRDTIAALPLFGAADTAPVCQMLQGAGFRSVDVRDLPQFVFEGKAPYIAVAVR
jgi:ubiquinone/menaquinone biosynthesis C-methylase UbiE